MWKISKLKTISNRQRQSDKDENAGGNIKDFFCKSRSLASRNEKLERTRSNKNYGNDISGNFR